MEKHKREDRKEPEIVFSKAIKAGKRIYYLDVKKARNKDLYVCITESKKTSGADEAPQFEKHKIFLYKEDFAHFMGGLEEVVGYVKSEMGEIAEREEWTPEEPEKAPEEAPSQIMSAKSMVENLVGKLPSFHFGKKDE